MSRQLVDGAGYEVRVAGHGPTVLLVHGFTGRGSDWTPFLPALHRAHTTVVVDLLGHGRSDAPADPACHAVERQATALGVILRRLDVAPAVVVGYSLGARTGLRLAIDAPDVVAGLILESPSAGIADPDDRITRRAADAALADRIERDGMAAFVAEWEAGPLFATEQALPEARRRRIHASRLRNTAPGLAASLRGAGQGAMEPLHDRLGGISVPALVIAGALDRVGSVRARAVAAGIPDAEFRLLADLGHAPHREAPAAFRRILIDQLATWSAT